MEFNRDPIFYHNGGRIQDADDPNATTPIEPGGWYFWDETWANYIGPYSTEEIARTKLNEYAEQL